MGQVSADVLLWLSNQLVYVGYICPWDFSKHNSLWDIGLLIVLTLIVPGLPLLALYLAIKAVWEKFGPAIF
jgi:hypothetical protein